MFGELFQRHYVVARHRSSPLAAEREEYLKYCEARGYSHRVLRDMAYMLMVIVRQLRITSVKGITKQEIEEAACCWARRQVRRQRAGSIYCPRKMFRRIALRWFGFLGSLECPADARSSVQKKMDAHHEFLRRDRALSESTIKRHGWHANRLLRQLEESGKSLRDISLIDIDTYLSKKAAEGWQRQSLRTAADALRSFLRYAEQRHWCTSGIASGIVPPRIYREEKLVSGLEWHQVKELLNRTKGDSARDIRDRAMLLLLARYGLRACEVRGLRLEDIDWENDRLIIRRSKQRCMQQYPMDADTGRALLRYLRRARPPSSYREVFLTLRAPFVPVCRNSLYHAVRSRLDASGIDASKKGPHSLRHACARRLLVRGFTLKQIGDFLGHRSADATRIYTKLDIANLRKVADISLRGLV